jgi:hypothetical protein
VHTIFFGSQICEKAQMRTRPRQLLILAMAVLTSAGCDRRPSSRDSLPLSATEPCLPSVQKPLIFYDETGTPSDQTPALSQLELRQMIDAVAGQTRDPIWLIRVKPSFSRGAKAGAIVYLTPQQETARTRTGRAYSVTKWDETMNVAPLWQYVQPSKPDERFADQLTLPSVGDLPFARPNVVEPNSGKSWPMSDEEVTSIVDFARDLSSYETPTTSRLSLMLNKRMAQDVQELPVLSISRHGDAIQMHFGYQHHGLWGRGVLVRIERTPVGYRFVEGSWWVS